MINRSQKTKQISIREKKKCKNLVVIFQHHKCAKCLKVIISHHYIT